MAELPINLRSSIGKDMGRYDLEQPKKPIALISSIIVIIIIVIFSVFFLDRETTELTSQGQVSLEIPVPEPLQEKLGQQKLISEPQIPENTDQTEATETQQQQNIELPALSESDALFKTSVLAVSAGLEPWLTAEQLIKKYIFIVNDFSQGLHPYKHFSFISMTKPFSASQDANGFYIARKSYQRFDQLAAAVDKIDVAYAVRLYQQFRPLFEQVYQEFAYAEEHKLEDIFKKAAANVLQTPIIETNIRLIQPTVYYKYADSKLEKLNPVQKQMLRMGPENTRIIQNKLRVLLQAFIEN